MFYNVFPSYVLKQKVSKVKNLTSNLHFRSKFEILNWIAIPPFNFKLNNLRNYYLHWFHRACSIYYHWYRAKIITNCIASYSWYMSCAYVPYYTKYQNQSYQLRHTKLWAAVGYIKEITRKITTRAKLQSPNVHYFTTSLKKHF